MALVTCPECGNHISERAAACPHCGVSFVTAQIAAAGGKRKAAPEYGGIKAGALVLRIIGLLYLLGGTLAILAGVLQLVRPGDPDPVTGGAAYRAGVQIAAGVAAWGASAMFMMFAGMGMALRDVARNSFR